MEGYLVFTPCSGHLHSPRDTPPCFQCGPHGFLRRASAECRHFSFARPSYQSGCPGGSSGWNGIVYQCDEGTHCQVGSASHRWEGGNALRAPAQEICTVFGDPDYNCRKRTLFWSECQKLLWKPQTQLPG